MPSKPRATDLIGRSFGTLKVSQKVISADRHAYWKGACTVCKQSFTKRTSDLRNGQGCPCQGTKPINLGDRFGYLKVDFLADTKQGSRYYKCTCSCGTGTVVREFELRNGKTISCGCAKFALRNDPPQALEGAKYIALNKDYFVLVDEADHESLNKYKWHYRNGYAARRTHTKSIYMHRELIGCPDDLQVDHINRDRLDNRRSNLRIVTAVENCANRSTSEPVYTDEVPF